MESDPNFEPQTRSPAWLAAFQYFEECESSGLGQDWNIDGVDFWPIIKSVTIGTMMHAGLEKAPRMPLSRQLINTAKRFRLQTMVPASWLTSTTARQFSDTLVSDPMSERPLWCFGNSSPMIENPLGYAHVHFDPYRLEAGRAGLEHWTLFYRERTSDSRLTGALLGPNRSIAAELASLDASDWQRVVMTWRDRIGAVIAKVSGLPVKVEHLTDLCLATVAKSLVTRDAFRCVFERRRPALILIFNYYQRYAWGLVAAAREAGIRIIDIQHGAQGRYHHAYHWARLPANGWSIVPPEFLLYGSPRGQTLSSGKCLVGAPSWYLWCRLAASTDKLPKCWKENAELLLKDARTFWNEAGKRTIPWHVYASYAEEAPGLIERIETTLGKRARILNKRHPAAVRNGATHVEKLPLPYTLASADGLITGYSATILEAAMMGTPCFVMSSNAALMYEGHELNSLPPGVDEAAETLAAVPVHGSHPEDRLAAALERTHFPSGWI